MLEPLLELLHRGRRSWIAGLGGKQTSSSSCSVVATGNRLQLCAGRKKLWNEMNLIYVFGFGKRPRLYYVKRICRRHVAGAAWR
jgi:hypothetical protein